ncbi:MAG TPA: sarcosine oxidase subunit alpha, partial [Porticoccaceae bacterium]|nr:sarcosine oxidase subunit alpha [Porticoccaceae bacterium]
MKQKNRLVVSGRTDPNQPINFTFNGKPYQGLLGDTLASALLANGVNVVGRSFKYARPRGIVGHGPEEPNGIIQLGSGSATVPNLKVTQVELYEGLDAKSVNGWPSVNIDVMGLVGVFGRLMPPGFYYKTFMYPKKLWMTYEHF